MQHNQGGADIPGLSSVSAGLGLISLQCLFMYGCDISRALLRLIWVSCSTKKTGATSQAYATETSNSAQGCGKTYLERGNLPRRQMCASDRHPFWESC